MIINDRAAKKAEELLPWETFSCETADEETWQQLADGIAAELREAYAENEQLQKNHRAEGTFRCTCNSYPHSPNCGLDERLIIQQAEIARLRAEIEDLKKKN